MPRFDSPTQSQSQDRLRPFRLTEQRIWPGCIEIEIEGELDLTVSDQLRAALDAAGADPCHVLLGVAEMGLLVSPGDVDASPPPGESGLDRSFEVTVAGGESVRLALPGTTVA